MKPRSCVTARARRLMAAIGRQNGSEPREAGVRYEPAVWLHQKSTASRRQRWSRWTKRLERAGLLERFVERSRDRVTHVRLTKAGRAWLNEHVPPELPPVDLSDFATMDDLTEAVIESPAV